MGLAITMDGSIVADYITTGVLNADVIRAGILKDYGGNFSLDFETGKLTMKKGSINIGNGNSQSMKMVTCLLVEEHLQVHSPEQRELLAVSLSRQAETLRVSFRHLTFLTVMAEA